MTGVIIAAHLRLAEELLSTARIITGSQLENFRTVSINIDDNPDQVREKLLAAVKEVKTADGTVILVDMFGGTPSNLSLSLLSRGTIEIITGVNLPMIIEAASSSRTANLAELIGLLTASGQRGIRSAGTILEQNVIAGK
jgi:mannose PTS system EIIA component